jgi:hypothetical protein
VVDISSSDRQQSLDSFSVVLNEGSPTRDEETGGRGQYNGNPQVNEDNEDDMDELNIQIEELGERVLILTNTLKQLDAQKAMSQDILRDLEKKLAMNEATLTHMDRETTSRHEELKVANSTYGGPESLTKTEKNNYLQD